MRINDYIIEEHRRKLMQEADEWRRLQEIRRDKPSRWESVKDYFVRRREEQAEKQEKPVTITQTASVVRSSFEM